MGVIHAFECRAHGVFEKRVKAGTVPRCPKGCSKSFVSLIFVQAVGTVSSRTRKADRLVRQAADMQGLSDISTSPSRSGGTVAQRNAARNRMRGPRGYEYPEIAAAKPVEIGKYLGAMTHKGNALSGTGFGHKYDANEWRAEKETGKLRHVGAQGPVHQIPLGSTGVSIERSRDKT